MTSDILTANQQDFLRYVNDDVRDQGDEEVYLALRSPEGLERWANSLKKMKRDTESQLASDKAERSEARLTCNEDEWLEFVSKRDRWRANSIRFKTGVENKLDEAMSLLRQLDTDSQFRTAVEQHRDSVLLGTDSEADMADQILWTHLGELI